MAKPSKQKKNVMIYSSLLGTQRTPIIGRMAGAGSDFALHRYREFVIYEGRQAYPEFLIKYTGELEGTFIFKVRSYRSIDPFLNLYRLRDGFQGLYTKTYSSIGLFPDIDSSEFSELFTEVNLSHPENEESHPLEHFLKGKESRIIIEGPAGSFQLQTQITYYLGSGKSTLCRSIARDQRLLKLVIMVELPKLRMKLINFKKEITIEVILEHYFPLLEFNNPGMGSVF